MKGIIIVNSHTHNSLLDYQPKRLKQEFELLGHNIDIVDNDCFVVTIENQGFKSKLHEYDFCIYLDKDINISNEYSLLHKMKKTRRRKITTWKKMRIVK